MGAAWCPTGRLHHHPITWHHGRRVAGGFCHHRRDLDDAAVSLLDNGPDTITLYPDTETTTDEYGNDIVGPASSGVTIRGRWQPATADESAALGQEAITVYR